MDNKLLGKLAVFHSLGVLAYVSLVALVMSYAEKIFGQADGVYAPVVFLMLLVLSAAMVGSLIFARPILMYIDGLKKEAVKLFLYTMISLLVITAILLVVRIAMV